MTDLQARAEAAADAVWELADMLDMATPEQGTVVFDHSAEEIGLHVMENYQSILHALQSEGWRPGDRAICSVDGHEHEVTILGKHEAHWTVDFGAFKAHVVEHRLRLPTPPEGETP